jgi:hypothetical protein
MSDIFNLKNTALIHNQPDADAIFGNWYRMLTLAAKDPEGYVRPNPDYPMNAQTFAQYFNRPLQTVEKTIDLLEEMKLITVMNGAIKVNACAEVNGLTQNQQDKTLHKETYPARNKFGMIPFDSLPPASQRILTCWNKLPLIKMTGLYPALQNRLEELLQLYGEQLIIDAICLISHCPFLLNQAENSTGWFITFKWMLEEDHLDRILAGEYLDRNDPMKAELRGEYEEDEEE